MKIRVDRLLSFMVAMLIGYAIYLIMKEINAPDWVSVLLAMYGYGAVNTMMLGDWR